MIALLLVGCEGGNGLAGEWGGTCDLGFATWGLGFELAPSEGEVVGSGEWEVTEGPGQLVRGDGPTEVPTLAIRCLSGEGCVNGTREVPTGYVLFDTTLPDGTELLLESSWEDADHVDGTCYWGVPGGYAQGTGPFELDREADPGRFSGPPPTTTSDPGCAPPTGSCDADPDTCEVDHFTDIDHCGVCGNSCDGCDLGRCDTWLPAMTMSSAWETCAVVGADLVCWALRDPASAAVVRSGDVVGVAMGDFTRCVLTTAGTVSCADYTAPNGPAAAPDLSSWTGVREIAMDAKALCALSDGGRVRCARFDDGTVLEPVTEGAVRVAGSRGGQVIWQLAGGQVVATDGGTWPATDLPLVDVGWGQYGWWGVRTDGSVYNNVGHDRAVSGAARVAAGWNQAAVLVEDGTVHAFSELYGPAGAVPGIDDAVAVVAGFGESCALRPGPRITCWDALDPSATWEIPLP